MNYFDIFYLPTNNSINVHNSFIDHILYNLQISTVISGIFNCGDITEFYLEFILMVTFEKNREAQFYV